MIENRLLTRRRGFIVSPNNRERINFRLDFIHMFQFYLNMSREYLMPTFPGKYKAEVQATRKVMNND